MWRVHRQALVTAALTLIRAQIVSGDAPAPGRLASFEDWDSRVRQTVLWCIRPASIGHDRMGRVTETITSDVTVDAWREVLAAWREAFQDRVVTTREVLNHTGVDYSFNSSRLGRAINEFTHHQYRETPTTTTLGKILAFRKDRIAGGLRLRQRVRRGMAQCAGRSTGSGGIPQPAYVLKASRPENLSRPQL